MSSDRPTSATVSPSIIVQPPSLFGRLGKWLLAAIVILAIAMFGMYSKYRSYFSPSAGPQERYHSLARQATKKIAVLSLSGVILDADGFVKQQIDRVRQDDNVVAVVLRVDSPGGTVTASDYLLHHLRKLRQERERPLVVSMGGLCASGGYYAAMAVGDQQNAIYAEPTTWTGSVGVVIPRYDVSQAMQYLNIKDVSLTSGPHKLLISPMRPLADGDRQILQGLVDTSFQRFKEVVISGRPKFKDDPAALDAVATGEIFSADQALANGLIDRIGFIEDAIARAVELAGVSPTNVRCVKYDRPPSLIGGLMGAEFDAPAADRIDLAEVLNLSTPRAYYLWTWPPAAMNSSH